MIITVKDEDKKDIIPIAQRFQALGYKIYATRNTAKTLNENGVNAIRTNKIEQPSPNLMDLILGHKIDLVIDTPSQGVEHSKDGFVIRRNAIETGVKRTDLSGYRNRTRNQSGKYRCEEADPDRYRNDRQEISMIEA